MDSGRCVLERVHLVVGRASTWTVACAAGKRGPVRAPKGESVRSVGRVPFRNRRDAKTYPLVIPRTPLILEPSVGPLIPPLISMITLTLNPVLTRPRARDRPRPGSSSHGHVHPPSQTGRNHRGRPLSLVRTRVPRGPRRRPRPTGRRIPLDLPRLALDLLRRPPSTPQRPALP